MIKNKQKIVLIALGSNLGERIHQLNSALEEIDGIKNTELFATSRLYESKPWGDLNQENFLNAACLAKTTLEPEHLLVELQRVEKKLGKEVLRKWGPRKIDLDMLDYEGYTSNTSELELPHPRVKDRPFVLEPIKDLEKVSGHLYNWEETEEAHSITDETWLYKEKENTKLWFQSFCSIELKLSWEDLEQTKKFASNFAALLQGGECITLNGDLGTGKTTFTRFLCESLNINDQVSSPSYALCQEYDSKLGMIKHWDFYRLQDSDDLESTGFFDQNHKSGITLIEWGSLFEDELPSDKIDFEISRLIDSEKREIIVSFPKGKKLYLRLINSAKKARHEYSCS